ncbi:hypothetical protein NDU88_008049 [Pleurodeles waltl]|uniref:Uncharacterized protein n=1 Tax=Pleurodeles waltl TaxID=8319 RepID=A0AAV7QMI5_PLEWA|nr:hypothetical protein NDU88_008049 [Pleurodeles waltl]
MALDTQCHSDASNAGKRAEEPSRRFNVSRGEDRGYYKEIKANACQQKKNGIKSSQKAGTVVTEPAGYKLNELKIQVLCAKDASFKDSRVATEAVYLGMRLTTDVDRIVEINMAPTLVAMEACLDRVGPLKVEPIAKKKSQKRKSKATGEGPFAKKGKPLRNKTAETTQENSEGDRRKRKRKNVLETYIKDIQGAVKKLKPLLHSKSLKPRHVGEGKRPLRVVPREVIQRLERCRTEVIQACEAAATDIGVKPE